jgi:CheY-like chemotaxis protein
MSNAVKFTEKGEVRLEVEYLGQKNATEVLLRFSVTDTGIGIAPQNQKRIFEAFTQEDSSTTKHFGGTGLGLSISNSLLHMMGSELALKSALGRGSSFYFDIALAVHAEEAYTAHDFSALSPILVVDDQKENCDVLLEILQQAGVSAEAVQQGIAAIAKLEKKKYPIVLMDYHMPYMNGLNTAQYIHEKMGEDAPEIILLSSSEEDEEIQHAGHMRYVRERLSKPVQHNALYNCLARIAKHPRSPQPLNTQKAIQKVLVVDDHHVNTILSERILQNILPNAQLKTAANGKEALETFKTFVPDLVLMDIQMPLMNGYEATQAIRKLPEGQRPLIFALTAGTLKGEAQKCIDAGMNDYLSKPITQDKLLFKIKEWLHFQVEGTAAADKTHEDEQADVLSQVQNLPSFNIERLRTLLDGDEGLLLHLLGEASAFLSTSLPELKSDYAKQNEKELNRKLHKLRGTALNLYFERLAALAAAFEAIAPEDATRPSLFHAILNEVQLLQRKVQEYQI